MPEPAGPQGPMPSGPKTPEAGAGGLARLAATVERLRAEAEHARAAADGRSLIELAKGVLIERLHCGPAEAQSQLTALAGQAGLSPLELAADIVGQAAGDRLAASVLLVPAQAGPDRSSAAARLRAAECGALAATDAQAVAEALLTNALAPLGAAAVAIWAAGPDASLRLAGSRGFAAEEAGRWHHVPPGVATLARRALTERRTVWLRTLDSSGLPTIGRHDSPRGGRVALPAGDGGRALGVLEIAWPGPLEPQPPAVQRQIEALAELCTHTLESLAPSPAPPPASPPGAGELIDLVESLHDPALVLVPEQDAEGLLADFRIHHANSRFSDPAGRPRAALVGGTLLETYPAMAAHCGLFEQIERVHATGEPFRSERVPLTALAGQAPAQLTAGIGVSRVGGCLLLVWRAEDEAARLTSLLEHAQRLGRIGGFEENPGTGEVIWNSQLFDLYGLPPGAEPIRLDQLPAHTHPDDEAAITRFLATLTHRRRPASCAFRLQRADGILRHIRVVAEPVLDAQGHLHSVRGAYQDTSAQHWTEVALAATRDQLAHTEQESAELNRLALQLQHAIMPPTRPPVDAPGLQTAVRYRPAVKDHLVGGDWYDAVVLPSKELLLCVGDVAGHGIGAATDMVVLRNALRGLATTGAGPAQLLSWLNQVAHHLTDQVTATAICGLFDPVTRVLRWARAGHLPPVLIRSGDTHTLPMTDGLLLGALAETTYQESRVRLEPGDTLLMYTDGLIERRDRSVQQSLGDLLVTAGAAAGSLERALDHLLRHSNADTDDDTCVVGIRLT